MKQDEGFKTCLWFATGAEAQEAAEFYVSVFPNSNITQVCTYPVDWMGKPAGEVLSVQYELNGRTMIHLNGGEVDGAKFNIGISFEVPCDDQDEVEYYTDKLSAVPEAEQCGWVCDRCAVLGCALLCAALFGRSS